MTELLEHLAKQSTRLGPVASGAQEAARTRLRQMRDGNVPRWLAALDELPARSSGRPILSEPAVGVQGDTPTEAPFRALGPWRKGPFRLGELLIDSEWRCERKWERVAAAHELGGRRVLDVGCGNGYYLWRALGAGAELALGVDPTLLYWMQFLAVDRLLGDARAAMLPVGDAELDGTPFDTVLSMGVLYHHKSPIEHLVRCRRQLADAGVLILETLVVDGDEQTVLTPPDRYANMRNVWYIPSPAAAQRWLARAGFAHSELVDLTPTHTDEQRVTDWSTARSLADALDPGDRQRTVEGLPAPLRALIVARV